MSDTNGTQGTKVRQWRYAYEGNVLVVTGTDKGRFAGMARRYDTDTIIEPAVRHKAVLHGFKQRLGDMLNVEGLESADKLYATLQGGAWDMESMRGPQFPELFEDLSDEDRDIFYHAGAELAKKKPGAIEAQVKAALADGQHAAVQSTYAQAKVKVTMRNIKSLRRAMATPQAEGTMF